MKRILYNELDKHFTLPKKYNPPYNQPFKYKRIPRKLKKKIFKISLMRLHRSQDINVNLWYYLEFSNPNYKRFLIKKCIESWKI